MAREGDQLVTTKLDRLGRSVEHLIALSGELQARGVDLVVLDQGIDTSTALGRSWVPMGVGSTPWTRSPAEFGVSRPTIYGHLQPKVG